MFEKKDFRASQSASQPEIRRIKSKNIEFDPESPPFLR